jgi:hypothetical protein
MNNRIALGLSVLCALLLMALFLRPLLIPAAAQIPTTSAVGRYSLAFQLGTPYFMDTQTGKIWVQIPLEQSVKDGETKIVGTHWVEVDSPVSKVKS